MQLDRQLRVDAGVDIDFALASLEGFIRNQQLSADQRHYGVIYSRIKNGQIQFAVHVRETKQCYIVRKA